MHDNGPRGRVTSVRDSNGRELRDARLAELAGEPDGVLQSLAEGSTPATATTRLHARQELDARRLRR